MKNTPAPPGDNPATPDPLEIKLTHAARSLSRCLALTDAQATPQLMAEELRSSLARAAYGDSTELDAFLMTQAHILDTLFNRALYYGLRNDGMDDDRVELALRSQRQCRHTVEVLKKSEHQRTHAGKKEKFPNELLSKAENAHLDRGR